MGLALTSGYYLDVNTPLPEPQLSPYLTLSIFSSPTSMPLLPWGTVEVIYLSVKRLVMTLRQEASGSWH